MPKADEPKVCAKCGAYIVGVTDDSPYMTKDSTPAYLCDDCYVGFDEWMRSQRKH